MGLIVIGSAKGAPGVTTLTVALAALTPGRTVAADLDPEGGDLALRYRSRDSGPLDPDVGLLSLAAALRGDQAGGALRTTGFRSVPPADGGGRARTGSDPVPAHLQTSAGGLEILVGVSGPDQAVGLGPLWAPLARALADTPGTVFADVGRIGSASPALPVIRQADAVILLARAELDELAHLRERLRFLSATMGGRYPGPVRLGVILVAAERDRAAGPRTEQLLHSCGLPVPVLGTVAEDARGAAKLRGVRHGRAERTTLIRSVRALIPGVVALAGIVPAGAPSEPALEPGPDVGPAAAAGPDVGPAAAAGPDVGPAAQARAGMEPLRQAEPAADGHRDPVPPTSAGSPGPDRPESPPAPDPYLDHSPAVDEPEQPEAQRRRVREAYRERRRSRNRARPGPDSDEGTGWPGEAAFAGPAERRP